MKNKCIFKCHPKVLDHFEIIQNIEFDLQINELDKNTLDFILRHGGIKGTKENNIIYIFSGLRFLPIIRVHGIDIKNIKIENNICEDEINLYLINEYIAINAFVFQNRESLGHILNGIKKTNITQDMLFKSGVNKKITDEAISKLIKTKKHRIYDARLTTIKNEKKVKENKSVEELIVRALRK